MYILTDRSNLFHIDGHDFAELRHKLLSEARDYNRDFTDWIEQDYADNPAPYEPDEDDPIGPAAPLTEKLLREMAGWAWDLAETRIVIKKLPAISALTWIEETADKYPGPGVAERLDLMLKTERDQSPFNWDDVPPTVARQLEQEIKAEWEASAQDALTMLQDCQREFLAREAAFERALKARNAAIVAAVDSGTSAVEVGELIGVSKAWVYRVVQQAREARGEQGK